MAMVQGEEVMTLSPWDLLIIAILGAIFLSRFISGGG